MNDEHNEEIYEQIRAIMAEHYPNFFFAVMDDSGDLYYDYSNLPIGKMLMREVQEELEVDNYADDIIINWDGEQDENQGWDNC